MKNKQIIEQIKKNIASTQKIFESCQKLSKSIFEVNFRVPAFLKLTISFCGTCLKSIIKAAEWPHLSCPSD